MKITKLGHCCMIIEENGVRILTDPGSYTVDKISDVKDIDLLLITDEHGDHLHLDSMKELLKNNPDMKIITQKSVQRILKEVGIESELLLDGQEKDFKGVLIQGYGEKHAVMHKEIPQSENVGYFIANRLFYPGDALTDPHRSIEILALPVSGPWIKVSDVVDYALELKPKLCFPVHDGPATRSSYTVPSRILPAHRIEFIEEKEFTV